MHIENSKNIFGSLVVSTKGGIPVKIVFVRNYNKHSECLYLLSTDCSLSASEIVRIYGNRWSIECFFKASKSYMKLGTELMPLWLAILSLYLPDILFCNGFTVMKMIVKCLVNYTLICVMIFRTWISSRHCRALWLSLWSN